MKRINFWALLAAGLIGLPVATFAEDDAKKPDAAKQEEIFKQLDKNGDGKLVPDEIPEDQGRRFDRLVRLGDKDDNGELTKAEYDEAIKRDDAPVQGGGFDRGGPGGPGGRPMIDFKQMLERLDKNKDGKISKDEAPEEGPGRMLREIMNRQNKDSLTADDFERARAAFGGAGAPGAGGRPEPGELLKRFDKNNDGKLQKDELPEPMRERFGRLFEKLGKDELTREDFGRALAELGPPPGAGGPGGRPNPEEQFKRMDANSDGKVTLDEIPEQFRDRVKPMFERAKKETLTLDDVKAFAQAREGEGRREGDRKPEGDRPREGERRPEARPDGDRPDARRPQGQPPREGDRRPEGRPGERPPQVDRRPEGDRPRDGERRPEGRPGERPPQGDRRPEGDGPRGPMPRFLELLDRNHDGRLSRDELDRLKEVFGELDRNKDGQLDGAELFGPPPGGPDGRGPREGDRRPEGDRPRDGERRPEGNRPPEGRRPDGPPPRDGDRRPEGDRPRDGERRPEADRPREGERRPGSRPEGRPPRREDREDREDENDKPRDMDRADKA